MKKETTCPESLPINTPLQPGADPSLTHPKPFLTVCPDVSRATAPLEALFSARNPDDTALVPSTADVLPNSLVSTQLASCRKPRNGKIARLPKPVRDVVNRMLFQNIPQERIVDALAELGIHVTQCNISNWKTHGGYREWRLAQEYAIQLRLHQDSLLDLLRRHDAAELPEIGLQVAATQLSRFFLTPEAQQLLASDPKEYERCVSMLNRISAQLKTLQQSRDDDAKALGRDHDPDRIRNETHNSLERLTEAYTSKIGESAKDPDIPHRNSLPNPTELFNFTDRPDDRDSRGDSFIEFMELLSPESVVPKPQLAAPAPVHHFVFLAHFWHPFAYEPEP